MPGALDIAVGLAYCPTYNWKYIKKPKKKIMWHCL